MPPTIDAPICCLCESPYRGFGNNAAPVMSGECCDGCNLSVVLPARFGQVIRAEPIARRTRQCRAEDDLAEQVGASLATFFFGPPPLLEQLRNGTNE